MKTSGFGLIQAGGILACISNQWSLDKLKGTTRETT